jgi:hypothetical protein
MAVPQQSAPNLTDRPRRNLSLTFNRKSAGEHRVRYFAGSERAFLPTTSASRAGSTRSESDTGKV